jgi:hypothetical protein
MITKEKLVSGQLFWRGNEDDTYTPVKYIEQVSDEVYRFAYLYLRPPYFWESGSSFCLNKDQLESLEKAEVALYEVTA